MLAAGRTIEDPHRSYWATATLLELGLEAGESTPAVRVPQLLAGLAAGALDALDRQPSEPRLLNCAAAALHGLGGSEAAEAMFAAASSLDPQAGRPQERSVAARRHSPHGSERGADLPAEVAGLSRRALEIAGRAGPAEGMTMSLCMIVRDEQEMLPRCLETAAPAVEEIVIVDTGSTDATAAIARSYGARVLEHLWAGSFAEARNVSLRAARGDWILYLDADEVLLAEDVPLLRSLTGRTWREAFYLSETNHTGDLEHGTAVTHSALRMFRNRPEYRFEGRVHEQIANRLPCYLPERIEATGVRIEHYGYLAGVRDARAKSARNIDLLRRQQEEGGPSAFVSFNLGSEHAAAGDAGAALAEFERSWAMLEQLTDLDGYPFAPSLMSRMVRALRLCGREQDALARAREGLARFPGFTDLVLEQALAAVALGQHEVATGLLERCIEMGDAPRRYTATVGCGSYLPRLHLAELKRSQGAVQEAIEQLECCVREHPGYAAAVLPYATALLAGGRNADAVVAELQRHQPDPTPAARFMLGTALYEAGESAAGESQFRSVLARQPRSGRARVALAEALLAQRCYAEAATEAAALSADDPLAPMACRSELFARIAGGDAAGTTGALQRAGAAGLCAAELDLFAAWDRRVRASADEAPLAREAVPLLEVMLEALLRVQDFTAFETLLALLEQTPLSARERRELLAGMYLRRGFAASAAEQWMAVCEQDPDVPALVGLARVAVARGMPREAGEFAAAALSRDPGNEAAAGLLTQATAA